MTSSRLLDKTLTCPFQKHFISSFHPYFVSGSSPFWSNYSFLFQNHCTVLVGSNGFTTTPWFPLVTPVFHLFWQCTGKLKFISMSWLSLSAKLNRRLQFISEEDNIRFENMRLLKRISICTVYRDPPYHIDIKGARSRCFR